MNDIIKKEANRLFNNYKNNPSKNWRKRHKEMNSLEKCMMIAENKFLNGYLTDEPDVKRSSFKFEKDFLRKRYNTYRNYLETRCSALPAQLEKKYNCQAWHIASSCAGMSNYININNSNDETFTIRISDHEPTGSGDPCDAYIYIDNRTWLNIKKEVFEIVENFLNN